MKRLTQPYSGVFTHYLTVWPRASTITLNLYGRGAAQ